MGPIMLKEGYVTKRVLERGDDLADSVATCCTNPCGERYIKDDVDARLDSDALESNEQQE